MVQLVVFVNLFFVPVLSLYLLYRKKQKTLRLNLDLLFQYCIITACNIPLTKVFIFLAKRAGGVFISIDSGYYTILAILSAIMLGLLSNLTRTIQKNAKFRTNRQVYVLKGKQKIFLTAAVNFFFVFTIIVFTPYDIFFGNQSEFVFGFSDFWWIMASFGLFIFVILTASFLKLPSRALTVILSLLFSITFCAYIQRMFLNLYITSMVGEALNTGEHPIWSFVNLVLWICVIAGTLVLLNRKGELWKRSVAMVSSGLIIVQAVALVSLMLTGDIMAREENLVLTTDGLYEVASEHNIIVFVLDMYDLSYVDIVLAETPDFYDRLDGFTRFENMTSVYSRSYPANSYLLTGLELDEYYIESPEECIDKAFTESTFLPYLKELGYSVDVYTNTAFVGGNVQKLADNYKPGVKVLYFDTVREFLKGSLYLEAPYIAKPFFWFFNELGTKTVEDNVYSVMNEAPMYQKLQEMGLSIGDERNSYKYIHTLGGHFPYKLNENCEAVDDEVAAVQQFKGCMKMVYEYLDQMKKLGVYDNSTIVITADHGFAATIGSLTYPLAPILFVKPAHAAAQPLRVSRAPVSHTDIFPTIIQEAGGAFESYGSGRPVFSIDENEQRTRIFHNAELNPSDGGEKELVDYAITGNSEDFSNWERKGSKRILNSMYAVSK